MTDVIDIEQLLQKAKELIGLLVKNLFGEGAHITDKRFSSILGLNSWRQICDRIISTCLSDLPISSSSVQHSDSIDEPTVRLMIDFEEFCFSIGFIPSTVSVALNLHCASLFNDTSKRMPPI